MNNIVGKRICKTTLYDNVQGPPDLHHLSDEQLDHLADMRQEIAIVGMEIGIKAAVLLDWINERKSRITDKKMRASIEE